MFNPEDIKDIIPHSFYKKDCSGHLTYKNIRFTDEGIKFVWLCDKCMEEVLLDFDRLHYKIY